MLAFNDDQTGTGEGFYSDGSFLQHYKHPYNGGYGKELLGNLSRLLHLLAATPWDVTDPDVANVRRWVTEGFDPLMARGDMLAPVCGREIARSSKQGHVSAQTVIEAVLRLLPGVPAAETDRFTALLKQWITEDTYRDFLAATDLASLVAAREVLGSGVPPRGRLVTHRQYPRMDKVVHHRPAFTFGVSAYSTRIYNYESIQNENLHGWHLSDGMTLLYDDDLGHYSEDYWPTVDPKRLPGTTVLTGRPADAEGQRTTSTADWAGGTVLPGTTLGSYGMDLRAYGSSLRALKSWFCLDDVIVHMGSGVSADAGDAETIVENRKLRDPQAQLTVDGDRFDGSGELSGVRWLHLAGDRRLRLPPPHPRSGPAGGTHRDLAGDQPQVRHRHPGDTALSDAVAGTRDGTFRRRVLLAPGAGRVRRPDPAALPGTARTPRGHDGVRARRSARRGRAARRELLGGGPGR